jgi:replicative DNA helicase
VRSLARSIRRPDKGGEPLPTIYRTFDAAGVLLRRGEVTMVAAPPGAGKSSLGVDIAFKAKVPTLYFSADSTELTMASRLAATITGRYLFDVEQEILRTTSAGPSTQARRSMTSGWRSRRSRKSGASRRT